MNTAIPFTLDQFSKGDFFIYGESRQKLARPRISGWYGIFEPHVKNDVELVRLAKTTFTRNLHLFADANDLGSFLDVDDKYLQNAFKTTLGITMETWAVNERYRTVQRLLMQSSCSLPEISRRAGFKNVFVFQTVFQAIGGIDPAQFRELPYKKQMALAEGVMASALTESGSVHLFAAIAQERYSGEHHAFSSSHDAPLLVSGFERS